MRSLIGFIDWSLSQRIWQTRVVVPIVQNSNDNSQYSGIKFSFKPRCQNTSSICESIFDLRYEKCLGINNLHFSSPCISNPIRWKKDLWLLLIYWNYPTINVTNTQLLSKWCMKQLQKTFLINDFKSFAIHLHFWNRKIISSPKYQPLVRSNILYIHSIISYGNTKC